MDRKDRVFGKWSPHWEGPFKISQVLSNGAYEIQELSRTTHCEHEWQIHEEI
jgi:hypothetical protein